MTNPLDELDEVLHWWTNENHTGTELGRLRREIDQAGRNRKQRAVVEECALNLLSTRDEQESDRNTGGRTARMAGFTRVYSSLETPLRHLLWNFAIADSIALHYQRPQSAAGARIATYVALASAGFWAFQNGTEIASGLPPVLGDLNAIRFAGLTFIALFTILSFRSRIRFRQLRHRFLTARSLAEALRVDFFQRLAGTGFYTLEVFAAHHETSKDPSITLKALEAAMACSGGLGRRPPMENPSPDPQRIQWAESYWLQNQHLYFGKPKVDGSIAGAAGREAKASHAAEKNLTLCFVLTSVAVVGTLLLILAPALVEFPAIKQWVSLDRKQVEALAEIPRRFADLLTPILGIASAFLHQRSAAHAITAQKYRRAALVLSDTLHRLADPNLTPAFRLSLLRYVAYQAVAETTDWGVHQREQSKHIAFR